MKKLKIWKSKIGNENRQGMSNKYVGTTQYKQKRNNNKRNKNNIKHPKRLSKKANQNCICGSGKKYKKCCMKQEKIKRRKNNINYNDNQFYISSTSSSDLD